MQASVHIYGSTGYLQGALGVLRDWECVHVCALCRRV